MRPPNRPQLSAQRVREILGRAGVSSPVCLLGVRGYYLRSMGNPQANDRGIYDDAIVLVLPDRVIPFNANTDPSVNRKGIATLRTGIHPYRLGKHGITKPDGGYPALRPATPREELPVDRDGETNPRPGVAINIHRGSRTSTSSEGCQTIHPDQWQEFITHVTSAMQSHRMATIQYVLVANDGSIA